jgi:hypothetical protein
MAHVAGTINYRLGGKFQVGTIRKGDRSQRTYVIAGPSSYQAASGANSWQETLGDFELVEAVVACEAVGSYQVKVTAISSTAGSQNLVTIKVTDLAGTEVANGTDLSGVTFTITVTGV